MRLVSYAQNFEDVILWRALKHIENGFYVDVGANDPELDSVTKAFYVKGWRGINIEPVSQWFKKLESERPSDINLQLAAGAAQSELEFYEIHNTGLSTFDLEVAKRHERDQGFKYKTIKVPVKTLTNICETYHISPIHFLKVDVEGFEKEVLAGLDLSIIRPWVILVEATLPSTETQEFKEWEPFLLKADYDFVYFDGLNRFYVAREQPQLKNSFNLPPNCFDRFALADEQLYCRNISNQKKQLEHALDTSLQSTNDLEKQLIDHKQYLEGLVNKLSQAEESIASLEQSETQLSAQIQILQSEAQAARLHIEAQAGKLAAHQTKVEELNHSSHHWWSIADGLSHELRSVYSSNSWRFTLPLRRCSKSLRWFYNGATAWLLLKPGSRPRRFARLCLLKFRNWIFRHPRIATKLKAQLNRFPKIQARLKAIHYANPLHKPAGSIQLGDKASSNFSNSTELINLSPRAKQMYLELKSLADNNRGS